MSRVKVFINNTEKQILSSEVVVEGDRTGDQAKIKIPPDVDAQISNKINYIQDTTDLDNLKLALGFEGHILDESGQNNHGYGAIKIPQTVSKFPFDFDENDYGGNPSVPVLTGTFTAVAGKVDKAMSFNGSTYITFDKEGNYDFERTTYFTISYWKKQPTNAANAGIISKRTSVTGNGWGIHTDTSGFETLSLTNTNSTNELVVRYAVDTADDVFHHFTWIYSGTSTPAGVTLYVDGVIVSLTTVVNNLAATILNNNNVVIGATGTTNIIPASTLMDDIHIFTQLLTDEQVTAIYQRGVLNFVTGKQGEKAINFDGTYSIKLKNEPAFDLERTNSFTWSFWIKGSPQTNKTIFAKADGQGTDTGYVLWTDGTDVIFELVNTQTTNQIKVKRVDDAILDGNFHHVIITYDGSSTAAGVILYIDGVAVTLTVSINNLSATILNAKDLRVGANSNDSNKSTVVVDWFKLYTRVIDASEITTLATKRNPFKIMKFGGIITRIDKEADSKGITADSLGKALGDTEVRGTIYNVRTPEFIIEDLVGANTDYIFQQEGVSSGIFLSKFIADGKLVDIARDLTDLVGKTFYTDGLGIFHLEPIQHLNTGVTFTSGENCAIFTTSRDDTELVNELIVVGDNTRYETEDLFSGNGTKKIFNLTSPATSMRVTISGVEKVPEVDYSYDGLGKTLTFVVAPASGTNNVLAKYEFEKPIQIQGRRQTSINSNGLHSVRLVMSWIKNRTDGVRFVQGYLNRYKDVKLKVTINTPNLVSSISENDMVAVVNSVKNLNASVVIKSIRWKYPEFTTEIQGGEYSFDEIEYDKQIVGKIHDLEGAITTVKELVGYESPEEQLNMTDFVDVNVTGTFAETLALTATPSKTEMFGAVYDATGVNYGQDDIYTE